MGFLKNTVSVLFIIISLFSVSAVSFALDGKRVFIGEKCGLCHDTEVERGESQKSGPPLWYAGSKFKQGFIAEWIGNPLPIRPMAYRSLNDRNPGNHPRLEKDEAKAVSGYLMRLTAKNVVSGVIKPGAGKGGGVIFEKKGGCYGCHRIKKDTAAAGGGLSGPSLVGSEDRLNPDWIYAYLKDHRSFKPPEGMPVYEGIMEDRELRILAGYLSPR